jgi:hypothetical protein
MAEPRLQGLVLLTWCGVSAGFGRGIHLLPGVDPLITEPLPSPRSHQAPPRKAATKRRRKKGGLKLVFLTDHPSLAHSLDSCLTPACQPEHRHSLRHLCSCSSPSIAGSLVVGSGAGTGANRHPPLSPSRPRTQALGPVHQPSPAKQTLDRARHPRFRHPPSWTLSTTCSVSRETFIVW